ncbi:hypothetical protein [Mumia sp. DW29H23]|uniref:hypothetical protein n=1 Tax=Mumia sp. DW29H23 TaxID=3421241 RepID=UPI003D68A1BA
MRALGRVGALSRLAAVVALAAGSLTVAATPAAAVEPTGGCWVWYAGTPSNDISTSLAPWSTGVSDHKITLSDAAPNPGERVTLTYSFDKGPKNGGPAASVTGTFYFSVNGGEPITATKDFGTVAGGVAMPGASVTKTFVAVEGDNVVTLEKVVYFAAAPYNTQIDCNGQTGGTPGGTNPRTKPVPTNVTATAVGSGEQVEPEPEPTETPTTPPPTTPAPTTAPTSAPTTPPAGDAGVPAKGKVTFACTLEPLGTKFEYPATISVSGYRAAEGDPVSMQASMSDLPGIAPLPIDGTMNVTLALDVAGKATTLKGGGAVKVPTKAPVPVPALKGSAAVEGDELDVSVKGFSFDFPAMSISADCTGDADLSKLGVGSEPPDDGGDGGAGGGGDDGGTGGSTDSLPKTGGSPGLPVIGLWAAVLVLLGTAGLVLVPARRRTSASG